MEEKIEKLRNAINCNSNFSEAFKKNIGTLTDLIVTVFPNYDYSNMEGILSTLRVDSNGEMEEYSSYDRDTNTLNLNTDRIFDDMIDIQHLFLGEILKSSTTTTIGYEGFKEGVTESMCTVMNEDSSLKKIKPLEHRLISVFSYIVDPTILTSSYMNGSVVDVIAHLDTLGISKQEFDGLAKSLNELHTSNTAFTDAEVQMIDMYRKVISNKMNNGELEVSDASKKFADFSTSLIYSRSELICMYPQHNFSNMTGFDNVEKALAEAVKNLENQEEILDVSSPTK